MRGNVNNLKPPSSTDEARERGRRGGLASGRTRRRRKALAAALKDILACPIPATSSLYREIKQQMLDLGLDWEPTVQDIPNLGIITQAAKNPAAYIALRDTIGEKPVEQFENITPPPPIQIGLLPEIPPVEHE